MPEFITVTTVLGDIFENILPIRLVDVDVFFAVLGRSNMPCCPSQTLKLSSGLITS